MACFSFNKPIARIPAEHASRAPRAESVRYPMRDDHFDIEQLR